MSPSKKHRLTLASALVALAFTQACQARPGTQVSAPPPVQEMVSAPETKTPAAPNAVPEPGGVALLGLVGALALIFRWHAR